MFNVHSGVLPKKLLAAMGDDRPHTPISQALVEAATMEIASVLARFSTRPEGLTNDDAPARSVQYGPNVLAKDQRGIMMSLMIALDVGLKLVQEPRPTARRPSSRP